MKRVDCVFCESFIPPVLEDNNDMFSKELEKAKCSKGKRVMFRKPVFARSKYMPINDYGYIRYCDDYTDFRLI